MAISKTKRLLIFSDLDGTLLDVDNYSFEPALPALEEIRKREIPLILCSSKTRAEIEVYQRKLWIDDPFISENGGALYIPRDYFRRVPQAMKNQGAYLVLELGTSYRKIRRIFTEVFDKLNLKVVGFGDMRAEEISSLLNLDQTEAILSKRREYDEPFYFLEEVGEEAVKSAEKEFEKKGLTLTTGGKLHHLTGKNDKGKAVGLLIQMFKDNCEGELITIGLGDSRNDLSLLESLDLPVLVRRKDNSYEKDILDKLKVHKAAGIGPQGWNQAVLDLIDKQAGADS
jgi:mannosyl-3-phosphoglycerate phosphatase